jgi:SAM-dependent methyltransferase
MRLSDIKQNRMYDEFAHLWPLISPPEEYAMEAREWREVLREKLGTGRHEILELGVGGGHNLSHLTNDFQATAVDVSEGMLALSKKLNPGVEHFIGDMRSVRLGKKFKAVLIHDAISYLLTEDDLRATFKTAATHLDPGGILVVAPDHFRETFRNRKVSSSTHTDGSITLTFIEYDCDPHPNDTTVESIMFYLIHQNDEVHIEVDRHITGLFPIQTWLDLMKNAGFTSEKRTADEDDDSQPLLVGVKQTPGKTS